MTKLKAFLGLHDLKERTIRRAALARLGGHFYAWGHYWFPHDGGKCRGNVSGALLSVYLEPGQVEQDIPEYWEPMLGFPWEVGELIDIIFSGLSMHDDKELHTRWAEQVLGAIRPGADLSKVPLKLMAYILETPEWLAAYAGETVGHQAGMLHGMVLLHMNGIEQTERVKGFHSDHFYKLYAHNFQASRSLENTARAALRALCIHMMEQRRGPMGYFIQYAVQGSSRHKRESHRKRWVELSQIFLQMVEEQ